MKLKLIFGTRNNCGTCTGLGHNWNKMIRSPYFRGSWVECAGPNDFDGRVVDQFIFRPDRHVKFFEG